MRIFTSALKYLFFFSLNNRPNTYPELSSIIWKVLNIVGIVSLMVLVGYVFWTLDRALEITDEAFYVLSAMYPENIQVFVSPQHWLIAPFWALTGTLVSYRGVGALSVVLSSSFFAYSLVKLSENQKMPFDLSSVSSRVMLTSSTIVAGLLYGSFINFSPSYNLFASVFTYTAMGFCFCAIASSEGRKIQLLNFLAGVSLTAILFSKFPTGIAILAALIFCLLVFEQGLKVKLIGLLSITIGAFSSFLVVVYYYSNLSDAQASFTLGVEMFQMIQTEPVYDRLVRYWQQYLDYFLNTIGLFYLSLFMFLLYRLSGIRMFSIGGFVALVWVIVEGEFYLAGMGEYVEQITVILAVLLVNLVLVVNKKVLHLKVVTLLSLLFLLPYSVGLGTGNMLHTQAIGSLSGWGALVAILVFVESSSPQKVAVILTSVLFSVLITSQVTSTGFRLPYHLALPLSEQSVPVKIGNIGTIKVDERTKVFVEALEDAANKCNIEPETPFISLYSLPGVALPLRGKPIFYPWINNAAQLEIALNSTEPEVWKQATLAVRIGWSGEFPDMPPQLQNFPENYRLCGSVIFPWENLPISIYQRVT